MPYFSLIIPTFNSSATLTRCLESIAHQDFKNLEVLVIDNLSSDSTLDIARSFSNMVSMTIISEADKGIYDAMNKGIQLAQGDYIYFLGSDDTLYDRTVFAQIHAAIQEGPVHVIYGNVISVRLGGKYDGPFSGDKITYKNICHQAIVFNKLIFTKVGLFNLEFPIHADWDHNIRWFYRRDLSVRYLDTVFAVYADTGISSTQDDEIFKLEKPLIVLRYGRRYLNSQRRDSLIRIVLSRDDLNASWHYRFLLRFILFLSRLRKATSAYSKTLMNLYNKTTQ